QGLVLYRLDQPMQLAGAPANLDLPIVDNGDSGRVVTAIFQPPQPFNDHRNGLLIADISDNSAHKISLENRTNRKNRTDKTNRSYLSYLSYLSYFHFFKALHRHMSDYRSSRVVCSLTLIASGSAFIRGDSGET